MGLPLVKEFSAGELRKLGAAIDPKVPDCALIKTRIRMDASGAGNTPDTLAVKFILEPLTPIDGPARWTTVELCAGEEDLPANAMVYKLGFKWKDPVSWAVKERAPQGNKP